MFLLRFSKLIAKFWVILCAFIIVACVARNVWFGGFFSVGLVVVVLIMAKACSSLSRISCVWYSQ